MDGRHHVLLGGACGQHSTVRCYNKWYTNYSRIIARKTDQGAMECTAALEAHADSTACAIHITHKIHIWRKSGVLR
jgi:hypothetical protein